MFSQTKDRYNLSLCMLHTMLLEKVAFLMQLVIGGVSAVTRTVLSRMGMVDRATKTRACTDSGVKDTADFSKIRYSQVWEDTDTLRQALDVKSGEHVFSIASAGDNLFALLLDDPAKLVALDFNASQLALCALKIAAFKHLTYPEFVHLLGFRFSDPIKMSPSQMYAERLRPHLAPQYRDFWDANLVLLDRGVVHTGRLESYWSIWRNVFLPVSHSKTSVAAFLSSNTLAEQHGFPRAFLFKTLFRTYFGKTVLALFGRDPAFFKHVTIDVGASNFMRLCRSVDTVSVRDNYYLEYILTGDLTGRNGLPAYLCSQNFSTIRDRVDRVELVEGDLRAYLADGGFSAQRFDAYNLSDVFEWMSEDMAESTLRVIAGSANHRARIAYWNLFVLREAPDTLADVIQKDKELSERLHARDRTFFYRNFCVDRVA